MIELQSMKLTLHGTHQESVQSVIHRQTTAEGYQTCGEAQHGSQ